MDLKEIYPPLKPKDYPVLVYRPGLSFDPGRCWDIWLKMGRGDDQYLDEGSRVFSIPHTPPRKYSKGPKIGTFSNGPNIRTT